MNEIPEKAEEQLKRQLLANQDLQEYGRMCEIHRIQHRLVIGIKNKASEHELVADVIKNYQVDVVVMSNKPKKRFLLFYKKTEATQIMKLSPTAHFFIINRRVEAYQNEFSRMIRSFGQETENRARNLTTSMNVEIYHSKKVKLKTK